MTETRITSRRGGRIHIAKSADNLTPLCGASAGEFTVVTVPVSCARCKKQIEIELSKDQGGKGW